MRWTIAMLAIAGCAAPPSISVHPRHSLAGRIQAQPQQCVPAVPTERLLVVDRRTLSYRSHDTVYVTRVVNECPGLYPGRSVVVHMIGGSYCSGDRISVIERGAGIRQICAIGPFTPYRRAN